MNFYPERDKDRKIKYYSSGSNKSNCEHKLSEDYVKKNKVVVKWFLADGRQLISQEPVKRWIVKK